MNCFHTSSIFNPQSPKSDKHLISPQSVLHRFRDVDRRNIFSLGAGKHNPRNALVAKFTDSRRLLTEKFSFNSIFPGECLPLTTRKTGRNNLPEKAFSKLLLLLISLKYFYKQAIRCITIPERIDGETNTPSPPSRSPDTVYKGPVIFYGGRGGGGEEYAFQGEVGWHLVIANRVRRGLWKIDY